MKTLSFSLVSSAILSSMLLGCSDNPAPTATPVVSTHSVATPLAKESGPGAWVFRYQDQLVQGWVDAQSGIVFLMGVSDVTAFCNSGRTEGIEMADVKDIFLPNADPAFRRLIERAVNKESSILVWDYSLWAGDWCQLFTTYPPKATGVGKLTWSDTDFLADVQPHHNTDVFGWKGNGVLSGVDGKTHTLNFIAKIMWGTNGKDGHFNYVFNIVYTPGGKK